MPKAAEMHVYLVIPFAEINDPKGLCKNLANGDVRVRLNSLDELPYVMGLVRQSYERQMGDGGQP